MKKTFRFLLVFLFVFKAWADEGMWLPYLLGNKTYSEMVKKGLKLSKEQLYSVNKSSLKDAIVIFGRGCTGEVVSKNGLIFTNHHCGYDAIAKVSTVEHNYLRDGFWAKNFKEEIPVEGLTVQFLVKVEDITSQVNEKLKNLPEESFQSNIDKILSEIAASWPVEKYQTARAASFFKNNQFLLFVYDVYNDVRLAGTPPESIGKFGGDTDNWEWPRHTGDFSVFRVYTSKEGKPAPYSPDNVPMKPKYYLPVSVKGIKEGDFTMILGYPGGTNRYETSFGVKLKTDIENPSLVSLREKRLEIMMKEMQKDPAVKLKLASYYAVVANYWKFFDGEAKQLLKYDVFGQKKKEEEAFLQWARANGKKEYFNLFDEYEKAYKNWYPYSKTRIYYSEAILGSQLLMHALMWKDFVASPENASLFSKLLENNKKYYQGEDIPSGKNTLAFVLHAYFTDIDPDQRPAEFYDEVKKKFGDPTLDETWKKYAEYVYSNSVFLKPDELSKMTSQQAAQVIKNDPAFVTVKHFSDFFEKQIAPQYAVFTNSIARLGRLYLKGVLERNAGKEMYPDANFTMRLSHGQVKAYSPRDAVKYHYVCTLTGAMEKYKPGDYEFDMPQKQIELYKKRDFGIYADPKLNDIVVTFISTDDITGGNSGSPVLNGNGELIGLAFDGNYEALSHKIAFDKNLNRTICVDIRYVLWIIEKLGNATNIIQELDIKKT